MKVTILFGLLLCLGLWNCSKSEDSTGTLEIVLKGTYADQPLVFYKDYTYFDGSTINFTKSEFFLNEIKLITADGRIIPVADVEFVAIHEKQTDEIKAAEGVKLIFQNIGVGDYKAIKYNVGLSDSYNSKNPSDYTSSHILADATHYWSGWNSYIFSKTEGRIHNQQNDELFAFHSGFDEAMRTIDMNKTFSIAQDETTSIQITLDHKVIFEKDGQGMDIYSNPIIHEGKDFMRSFMDQYKKAFKIF
ncbi:MAG: hypothetical protein M3Q56_03995 [Bacteroidota bacterium]|nr:hypothetical protein [Bacteroidota bacterium]